MVVGLRIAVSRPAPLLLAAVLLVSGALLEPAAGQAVTGPATSPEIVETPPPTGSRSGTGSTALESGPMIVAQEAGMQPFAPGRPHSAGLHVPLYEQPRGAPVCESWLYRPLSAGWFLGGVSGGSLIDDWVEGRQGYFTGLRLGWDCDHSFGCEMRFAFGNVALADSLRARAAQQAADDAAGLPVNDPSRYRFDRRRNANLGWWDVSLLYYPWADAECRPYFLAGVGTVKTEFIDRLSTRHREMAFGLPIALGVKYRHADWLALRLELADNISFGDSLNGVHYLSLTAGLEIRFGGRRTAYWPWSPGRHYW
ncbi:MAG: porin family protein [Planctomycetota bacterium]|jgi:opacity protein-like surface antigen